MYSDYFKINFHPFSSSADKRIFYPSTTATKSMAVLQHSLIEGDRLLILTGAAGIGKSCLANKLISELSTTVHFAYLHVSDYTEVELLQSIALAFDVSAETENRVMLLNAITTELRNLTARGKRIILLLDSAHSLNRACLRLIDSLIDKQSLGEYCASILLIGRPELLRNLIKEFGSVRDQHFRMISTVKALSLADTIGYINYRLSKAGLEEQQIFSKNIIRSVYEKTQGTPRRINAVCDIALLGAYAKKSQEVDESHLQQAMQCLGWASPYQENTVKNVLSVVDSDNATANKVSVKDVMGNSVSYKLSGGIVRIGRAPDCEIRLNEINISRYQAEIVAKENGFIISNKGSTTPIMLNANSVDSAPLKNGDVVSIGNYVLHFSLIAEQSESLELNSLAGTAS